MIRLASDLGGLGILFVLPSTVSRSTWESHISPTAPRYNEVIERLRGSGLCEFAERSGAYRAGELILKALGISQSNGSFCIGA